jgi:hypothetical protein
VEAGRGRGRARRDRWVEPAGQAEAEATTGASALPAQVGLVGSGAGAVQLETSRDAPQVGRHFRAAHPGFRFSSQPRAPASSSFHARLRPTSQSNGEWRPYAPCDVTIQWSLVDLCYSLVLFCHGLIEKLISERTINI